MEITVHLPMTAPIQSWQCCVFHLSAYYTSGDLSDADGDDNDDCQYYKNDMMTMTKMITIKMLMVTLVLTMKRRKISATLRLSSPVLCGDLR